MDLTLLYTGADKFYDVQRNIDKSIGGFVSNSVLANNAIGNLFSDISYFGIQENSVETKAIAIENTKGSDITNLNFYYDFEGITPDKSLCKFEFAFVTLLDGEYKRMEKIGNFRSSPAYAEFITPDPIGVANKSLVMPTFTDGTRIGMWIRRTVNVYESMQEMTCEELETYLNEIKRRSEVKLYFEFD